MHMLTYSGVRLILPRAVELLQEAILGAGSSYYLDVNDSIEVFNTYNCLGKILDYERHVDCGLHWC